LLDPDRLRVDSEAAYSLQTVHEGNEDNEDNEDHDIREAFAMTFRRKVLALAVVAALLLGAVASVIDWRFWYRWHTLPEDAGEWPASYYQPIAEVPGDPKPFFPVAREGERTIDPAALEAAAEWAQGHNSAALLVLHRGVVQMERYWQDIESDSLFTGRAMTRSLIPPLFAIARDEGTIDSLEDPIGRYLPEWRDDPRGDISIRNLLFNLSGLENAPLAGDPDPDNKNSRLALGGDFRKAALAFELEDQTGEFFALSNANGQVLAAVLESATGEAYEDYLNSRLWAPLGADSAYLYMDHPGGMPAVYCCYRATPRDWLRYGAALLNDGRVNEQQIWPAGWVEEMTTPSDYYPLYAYQIWTGNPAPGQQRIYSESMELTAPHGVGIRADRFFYLEGGGYRTMVVLPDHDLVILRLGYYDANWTTSALPNLILGGMDISDTEAD
jgi:CubicO group peptidase (beta-lactamase class C family)